jgi:hypothetical protein
MWRTIQAAAESEAAVRPMTCARGFGESDKEEERIKTAVPKMKEAADKGSPLLLSPSTVHIKGSAEGDPNANAEGCYRRHAIGVTVPISRGSFIRSDDW